MSGTTSGVTSFVMGRETDGNREMRTFKTAQAYDLDFADVKSYSTDDTEFPVIQCNRYTN